MYEYSMWRYAFKQIFTSSEKFEIVRQNQIQMFDTLLELFSNFYTFFYF